jgi:hypothetical protein
MSENKEAKNELIEKFIKANFGDEPVQEIVLLVRKDHREPFIQTLKGSGLAVIAMLSKMAEHNVKRLESMGQDINDYWQVHVLVKFEQSELLLKVLQNSGMSSMASQNAKAIVDFYTKDGSGETLQ